ncbi:MAG: ComEC/Rec2 family competence protein [Acetatifactor sp.]
MKRPLFTVGLILAVIVAVRLGMGDAESPPGQPEDAWAVPGETVVMTGQVCRKDENSFSLKSVILYQTNLEAAISQQSIPYQEKFICETVDAETVYLGATVTVRGIFETFSEASNPGEFDSAAYYRSIQTYGKLKKTEILFQELPRLCIRERLYRLRCFWKERLYGIFPEKEAAVMSALLLGDRDDLDSGLKDLYRRNGILHILSISSLHITILGMGLYRLLRRFGLPTWAAALAGGLVMVSYGAMTGFGVSACRAIAMYLLRMLAEITGRTYDMLNALGAVGAGMLLYNPNYLENSGFLLSFSSVLGIGIVYPALVRVYAGKTTPVLYGESRAKSIVRVWKRKIREGALLSLSITLATLPIQLWFYYEVPIYTVAVNLLVLPFVKPLLIFGFAALVLPFGGMAAGPDRMILGWYEALCSFFDALPFSVWNPGRPGSWQIAVYYCMLGGIVWKYSQTATERRKPVKLLKSGGKLAKLGGKRLKSGGKPVKLGGELAKSGRKPVKLGGKLAKSGRKPVKLGGELAKLGGKMSVLGLLSVAVLVLGLRPAAQNQVIFLNVGQGDCGIVRTASGENYLFDCGSSSRSSVGKYILLPFLKYYGIRTIDGILLSHPDTDHVNGVLELLTLAEENGISIKQLVLPDIGEAKRKEALGELIQAAEAAYEDREVDVRYLAVGDSWQCGDAAFLCLHPLPGCDTENANEYSLCVYAIFGKWEQPEMTVLFTGDVEGEGEKELIEALIRYGIHDVTLLKAAHHGSRNSTSMELLEQLRPDIAVISCGENNRYGHPHEELLGRFFESGIKVLRTDELGAISVQVEGEHVKVAGHGKMK